MPDQQGDTSPDVNPTEPLPPMPDPTPQRLGTHGRRAVLGVLVAVVAGGTYWLAGGSSAPTEPVQQGQVLEEGVSVDNDAATAEGEKRAADIIAKVSAHFLLPADIQPTVATIIDVEKLREQNEFYNSAENGNFLLVLPKRAILYDEERDLILDVAPVRLERKGQVIE
ncbi:hypothetical protein COU77_01410 [Candidatus Peregrinibacteria bacterium CG10_big_fil_rev_8_21_14_0_10_49_16]|nr:MAG: hypothetical protein COW95_00340 [Candidatus Peregrinibacteria bacterium CG22_combo_CG10-13_8_21_14_all_49_11]PIR52247.1 MAG: hypothetical protein COU77_01410 [Candidatus Peregrinibacteria bacterium CG10_big_fil_rev_8_21_14_0_10_49_16]